MKRFLLFSSVLLFAGSLFAQTGLFGWEPPKSKTVFLPKMKRESSFSGGMYLITDNQTYHSLFADSVQKKLPEIDFTRYDLVGDAACIYCGYHCSHRSCHRNACQYHRFWYLSERSADVPVTATELTGENCTFNLFGYSIEQELNDTTYDVAQQQCPGLAKHKADFTKETILAKTIWADDNERFTHSFYLDTAARRLVWRTTHVSEKRSEHNGQRTFFYSVPKLPKGYVVVYQDFGSPLKED